MQVWRGGEGRGGEGRGGEGRGGEGRGRGGGDGEEKETWTRFLERKGASTYSVYVHVHCENLPAHCNSKELQSVHVHVHVPVH